MSTDWRMRKNCNYSKIETFIYPPHNPEGYASVFTISK